MDRPARRALYVAALGPAAAVGVGLYTVAATWGTWADPFVDFGRELYLPWQITEGKVLYRDLAHFNGPLSVYFNALVFGLLGVKLQTLVIVNLLLLAGFGVVIYRIALDLAGALPATAACATFFGAFAAGDVRGTGNFNYLCPYSHELTHGVLLSLVALLLLGRFIHSGRLWWLAGAWLAVGVVFATKIEVFVAAAAALGAGTALYLWTRRPSPGRMVAMILTAAGALLSPALAAWLLLGTAMPLSEAAAALGRPWSAAVSPQVRGLAFYLRTSGLDDIADSLRRQFGAIVFWLVLLAPVVGLGVLVGRRGARRRSWAIAVFGVVVCVGALGWRVWPFYDLLRPLPALMLVVGAWSAIVLARSGSLEVGRLIVRLSLIVFALALLAKVILNAGVYHYGFVLAMPATMVGVLALAGWLPAALDKRGAAGSVVRAAALAALVVLVAGYATDTAHRADRKRFAVSNGVDAFLADGRGVFLNAVVSAVSARIGPEQTVLVLPEGVMVNYLSRRANPTPYINFMPTELAIYGEQNMVAALKADPPDLVVLVHKDTSEYGFPFFGKDYGDRLRSWVDANYREAGFALGARPFETDQFGVVLLERLTATPGSH